MMVVYMDPLGMSTATQHSQSSLCQTVFIMRAKRIIDAT